MTIKELVIFTGKSERTVRRWVAKCNLTTYANMAEGTIIDYTIDEVEQILNAGSMSKDAVIILMNNARKPTQIDASSINPQINNMEDMAKMISIAVASVMVPMMQQMTDIMKTNFVNVKTPQLSLPSAPDIKPRALLRQLVNDYATSVNISQRESWNELYKQFYYRLNENVKIKAKNLNIIPLDYLEHENKLLTACSIMKGLING